MITPKTLLKNIPKITPKYAKLLEKLGILTVKDLLFYFPFRYDDFSKVVPISEKHLNETVTIEGKIIKTKLARIFRKNMSIAEIIIQDENNIPLKAVWFNQPYILETLHEGVTARLSGKMTLNGKFLSMSNPAWEKAARDATNTGRLVPVYSETKGLTSKWLRWQMKMLLNSLGHEMSNLDDPIPTDVRKRLNLYDLHTALGQIHFPENPEKLQIARKRFAFQEMFLVQLKALQTKKDWENHNSVKINFNEKLIRDYVAQLPFKLTGAQRKSSFEILKDLEKSRPMNRLLNGDVGSGKTVVASIAALQTISAGYQVAILAPTEVLARQHFESFCRLFSGYDFNVALLTNNYKIIGHPESDPESRRKNLVPLLDSHFRGNDRRKTLIHLIKSGKINLIIGTHAIIQKEVKFNNLALAIIDEQHRFGVAQRAALQQETMQAKDGMTNAIPHLLTMTATPIPRTLAIAFSGNLDISILDEMPKNRRPIITKTVSPEDRQAVYNFITQEIKNGWQVFVIFPLIEESKALSEVKAATVEHKKLSAIFPKFKIELLHGKLKSSEKEKVMRKFKDKEFDILVSTSVVEVGIDVPNAAVMIVEDADRFGLSQLHQFRGRVGRGEHQSHCFLFANSGGRSAEERLKTFEQSNDGFAIAQKDLELRGPGQFFGTLQSGLPDIVMENLTNIKLVKYAQLEAKTILAQDPKLKKHPVLRDALQKFTEKIHLE